MWNVDVCAYCLMPNHYHLLIHTPEGNLSRFMRHVGSVYTQRFNRVHGLDGPLFRGRYKSILVSGDSYLKEVLRYIHRNPIGPGLSQGPGDYQYSSHTAYLSRAKKWDWVARGKVLSMFSSNPPQAMALYQRFVERESPEKISKIYEAQRQPPVLGPAAFLEKIKKTIGMESKNPEVPQAKVLRPDLQTILETISRIYQVDLAEVRKIRRGYFNELRGVAIYLARTLTLQSLEELAQVFGFPNYSSVSSAVINMEKRMARDKKLKIKVNNIRSSFSKKSQPKTCPLI